MTAVKKVIPLFSGIHSDYNFNALSTEVKGVIEQLKYGTHYLRAYEELDATESNRHDAWIVELLDLASSIDTALSISGDFRETCFVLGRLSVSRTSFIIRNNTELLGNYNNFMDILKAKLLTIY